MKKALLLLFLFNISFSVNAETASKELFSSINARLSFMEDVALYKAHNQLAIEDIEREKVVIEKAKLVAKSYGLNPEDIEHFFKAQINVAKAIQFRFRADWFTQPSSRNPRDLEKEVRPELIKLGDQIIRQISEFIHEHGGFDSTQFSEFDKAINVKHVLKADKLHLFKSLKKARLLQ